MSGQLTMCVVKDPRLKVGVEMMVCLGFNLGRVDQPDEGLGYGSGTITHLSEEDVDEGLVRVTVEF